MVIGRYELRDGVYGKEEGGGDAKSRGADVWGGAVGRDDIVCDKGVEMGYWWVEA